MSFINIYINLLQQQQYFINILSSFRNCSWQNILSLNKVFAEFAAIIHDYKPTPITNKIIKYKSTDGGYGDMFQPPPPQPLHYH